MKINISLLRPHHFQGVVNFTTPQQEAMFLAYKKFNKRTKNRESEKSLYLTKRSGECNESKAYSTTKTKHSSSKKLLSFQTLFLRCKENFDVYRSIFRLENIKLIFLLHLQKIDINASFFSFVAKKNSSHIFKFELFEAF